MRLDIEQEILTRFALCALVESFTCSTISDLAVVDTCAMGVGDDDVDAADPAILPGAWPG